MRSATRVIVDTNVIFDVLHADPNWCKWSQQQLEAHAGGLLINPLIYAEICYQAESQHEADAVVTALELAYSELPLSALFLASKAYRQYRLQGGNKTAPLADFFIGAHAEAEGLPILTRDETRYKSYFPSVPLISP